MVNGSAVFVSVQASGWTRMEFGYYGSLDSDLVRFMFDSVYFSLTRLGVTQFNSVRLGVFQLNSVRLSVTQFDSVYFSLTRSTESTQPVNQVDSVNSAGQLS
ncbi:hypothetical protein Hanom_Chr04g00333111 [Helianthus anomalus]